jgi:hypothetical protein
VSGPPNTLDLIAQTIAAQHGTLYAQRWLAAQQSKQSSPQRITGLLTSDAISAPLSEPLSGPLRPSAVPEPTDIVVSPVAARQEALSRFEAKAQARAAKLRSRVGFEVCGMRRDKRTRLERFHNQLVMFVMAVAVRRGYRNACTVTVHTVMELVGACLGIKSSSTLYSYLHDLKKLGLIDFKGHVTTVTLANSTGETFEANRCDGVLLCVRLGGCKSARLNHYDYQDTPRDLQADIGRGHTAYRLLKRTAKLISDEANDQVEESMEALEHGIGMKTLILWSLNPSLLFNPLDSDSSTFEALTGSSYPTELFDLSSSSNRNHDVDKAAQSVARCLGDLPSLNFYRRLLWQLLRAHDRSWNFFSQVYHVIVRVMADKHERFARKPGALLVARLKASSCWDELWRDQGQWVGETVA